MALVERRIVTLSCVNSTPRRKYTTVGADVQAGQATPMGLRIEAQGCTASATLCDGVGDYEHEHRFAEHEHEAAECLDAT
jgi:hypothetical protein